MIEQTTVGAGPWLEWAARWDRFQEAYVPDRELQFGIVGDYIELRRPHGRNLRILDLCCGPGAAAGRLLRRFPTAELVAVDFDPWLLALGQRTAPCAERIIWLEANLRDHAWIQTLQRRRFDAVVATTAMQWFTSDEIARIYRDIYDCLLPSGALLTSDVIPWGDAGTQRLSDVARRHSSERAVAASTGEHWATFWAEARGEPAFAELLAERDRRIANRSPLRPRDLDFHDRALRAAGFNQVGEVWRLHANAILLALRERTQERNERESAPAQRDVTLCDRGMVDPTASRGRGTSSLGRAHL